ncbi:hypothetical protein [Duganella hordei]
MTQFRKLWITFVDAIKPQVLREQDQVGLHSIFIDTRPFNVASFSDKDR